MEAWREYIETGSGPESTLVMGRGWGRCSRRLSFHSQVKSMYLPISCSVLYWDKWEWFRNPWIIPWGCGRKPIPGKEDKDKTRNRSGVITHMEAIHSNHYKPMSDTNVYKTAIENGCPRWQSEAYLKTGYCAVDQLFKNFTRLRDHKKHAYILMKKAFRLIVGGRIVIYGTALQGLFPRMRKTE